MTELIAVTRAAGVVTVALNRPNTHNALTPPLIAELTDTFHALSADPGARVIILTGNGRSFCAGADLNAMRAAADYTPAENLADGEAIFDLMAAVDGCSKPVIGRINGAAIGGGAGLVACCDITVAVARARFAFSEARLGLVPAVISPFVVARIGPAAARELFLTGERFDADAARRIGLVQHVVADADALDAVVAERVAQLLQAAPGAQAAVKELLRTVAFQPTAAMRGYTTRLIADRRAGAEGREGMSSFLEKRAPAWQTPTADSE